MGAPYVPILKMQHEEILLIFESSERLWRERELEQCRSQLETLLPLLTEHLESERAFLFENLRPNPRLCEGGPFCGYFFEFFMHNRPLVVAEKMIASRQGLKKEIEIPKSIEIFFNENSLLKIPLEEHMAIQAFCQELVITFKSYTKKDDPWIDDVFSTTKDLIATNQRKEETCLWAAAQQIMEPQLFAELSKKTSS